MPIDYTKPVTGTLYSEVFGYIRDNIIGALKQDPGNGRGVPNGAIRFSEANSRWEKKAGGIWGALRSLAQTYEIRVADSIKLAGRAAAYYRNASNLNAGTLSVARLPNHDAAKITSGSLHVDRIPNHDAAKIASGTLDVARISDINANKITGVLDAARIPDTLDARGVKSVIIAPTVDPGGVAPVTGVAVAAAVNNRTLTLTVTLTRQAA